jgi:hypothetical protein
LYFSRGRDDCVNLGGDECGNLGGDECGNLGGDECGSLGGDEFGSLVRLIPVRLQRSRLQIEIRPDESGPSARCPLVVRKRISAKSGVFTPHEPDAAGMPSGPRPTQTLRP